MTTAQVKTYLGIPSATTTYDADIARYLPIVEATVNRITAGIFLLQVNGTISAGSKAIAVSSVYTQSGRMIYGYSKPSSGDGFPYGDSGVSKAKPLFHVVSPGQPITGDGIASGAIIESVNAFNGSGNVMLSINATSSGEISAYTGIPEMYNSAIAHGVWWMISQQKTASNDTSWISRSVGPVSETRSAADSRIDGKYGMPAWFVKTFPMVYQ